MQTNAQEQEDEKTPSLLVTVLKLTGISIVFALVVCAAGGGFASGPKDIPVGMSWVNAPDLTSSTFYVLQGGPHLILELNKRSMMPLTVLMCGFMVFIGFLSWQGLTGKLKDRAGEPRQNQFTLGVGMAVLVAGLGYLVVGGMFQHQKLELDAAADTVSLDGATLARLQDVAGFRAFTTRGSKGGVNYHLEMELNGAEPVALGGRSPHSDVEPLATMLNRYLAEQRQPRNP